MSAGGTASGFLTQGGKLFGKMFSSVSSFVIGVALMILGAVAVAVVVPYVGLMAWHHDNLQLGADKATAFVLWEARVVGAAYEGGTNVTTTGFQDGQTLTRTSLKTVGK